MSGRGIFTKDDGRPVVFFLHKTIKGDKRILLREEIQKHGGQVTDDDDEAETVLMDDYTLKPTVLQLRYAMRPINSRVHDFWVEPLTFVRKCVNWGVYSHEARKVGMPGRPGNEEGLFDDEHLVQFLATHLPDKSAGGRTGLEPYKRLVALYDKDDPDTWGFEWVRRHTYQSWHERYRKNQARLDPLIDAIAAREDPPDTVTYERNRMYRQGNPKHIYVQEEEEEEEGEEEEQPQQEQDYEEEDEIREFSPTQVEYQTAPDKTMEEDQDEEGQLEEDQYEYEYEQPASRVAGQKRRHSDGDALIAQRQRWDKRPRLTGSQIKGKQRAVEPVEEVYEEEPRPPSPTLVDRRQSQIYPPLPEDTPEASPRESASPASIASRYTPSPSTQPLPSISKRLAASRQQSPPTRNLAAARPSRPLVPVSTASQSQPPASQSQTIAARTRTAAPRNQSAARTRIKPRRAPVIPAAEDAPAGSTRARSRGLSTEPSPPRTQKSPRPNRKQRERRHVPGSSQSEDEEYMQAVREEEGLENPFVQDGDEDGQPPVEVEEDDSRDEDELRQDEDDQPPAETLEDEDAVVHQLMDNSALSAGGIEAETYDEDAENRDPRLERQESDEGSDEEEEVDDDADAREGYSDELSSDDAQTREHISFQAPASPISAPPARRANVFLPKVPPQVRRLARGTQPASQSLPLPQTPAPGNTSRSLRTSLAADLLSLSMQRSPPRHRGLSSESSVESYPLPNTRASTEKQRLTQEQMQSPYVPAQGTRAARLLRSRLRAQEAV
uniref:BRCT domain-containing protein n=1 Tax=Schizophyllum commune (strain H4-8 / FGSC 9210) TaxID=578458 RepID=D8PV44_SCHCM